MFYAIGDVHGQVELYQNRIAQIRKSDPEAITFQVGDFGLGFKGVNMPQVTENDYFISGNHDDSLICEKSPHFLGDFGCREFRGVKVFWVSGAMSTDRQYRTEGIDWWAYEELTYEELDEAAKLFIAEKPQLVITHDCPMQVRERMLWQHRPSGITVQALTQMFHSHQPKRWVFGHHHFHHDDTVDGTLFSCCAELEVRKLDGFD
jgi:predicted phosphodiesterase